MHPSLQAHLIDVLAEIEEIVWCINANTYELIFTNKACEAIWGHTPEQMKADQQIFFRSLHPDDFGVWQSAIAGAKENGHSYSEIRVRHKDGSYRYLQGDAIFKQGYGEMPDTITGIGSDVTQSNIIKEELARRNNELENTIIMYKALQRKNEQILSLLKSYQNAVDTNILCSITDKDGTITYVNEKFCETLKYHKDELIGKNHRIINSGLHPKEFFTNLWETVSSGKMWNGEIRNRAKDGTYCWVDTVIMPIVDSKKNITGYLSLRSNINERKRADALREEYLKTIKEMLFMVSHEMRRPITGCQGVLQLLLNSAPSQQEYNEYLKHMMEAANELDSYSRKLNEYLQNANLKGRGDSIS